MKRIIVIIFQILFFSIPATASPSHAKCDVAQKYLSRTIVNNSGNSDVRIFSADPKSGISIIRNGKIAPVTARYRLKQSGEMGGRKVAVYEVMFGGFEENLEEGEKKRWAGIGTEIRDSACETPLVRRFQIRRGSSLVDNFDDEILYSEAAIGE